MRLNIDPEFESFISPLEDEEYEELTNNILEYGIQDPIKTWNGYIIDGHNRYNILEEQGMLDEGYPILDMTSDLDDKVDAKLWMVKNQLGRRNLTPAKKKYYIGEQYNLNKQKHGTNRFSKVEVATATSIGKLKETIADEHKMSPAAVMDAATFAEAVDIKEDTTPGFKKRVFSGTEKMTRRESRKLVKEHADPDKVKEAKANSARFEVAKARVEEELDTTVEKLKGEVPPVLYFEIERIENDWKELYILMSKLCHPDRGGSEEAQEFINSINTYFKAKAKRSRAQKKVEDFWGKVREYRDAA